MARKKVALTITESAADVKRKEAHEQNMQKVVANKNVDELIKGKELNTKTYEFACDDCLDDAVAKGEVFCLYNETLNEVGRCKCGKFSTHKAILI